MTDTSYAFMTGVGVCAGVASASISISMAFGAIRLKPMKLFTVSREELWKKAVR